MSLNKYFWDLNRKAVKETAAILNDAGSAKHIPRIATLLSRCDKPGEVFAYMDKKVFINSWPKVRKYWKKTAHAMDFLEWWDMIYDEMTQARPKDRPGKILGGIGNNIKSLRLEKGLTQQAVSDLTGLPQADISRIERGRNITLTSLIRILKALKVGEFSVKIV